MQHASGVTFAMTSDHLETTDYDLIVIGTGFVESLVARCLPSLFGKRHGLHASPPPPPRPALQLSTSDRSPGACSAAARAGKSVLHLDGAPQYGSHWAALHLDELVAWASALQARGSDAAVNGHVPLEDQQRDAATRCLKC